MDSDKVRHLLDDIARDIDLLVFRLEQGEDASRDDLAHERRTLRRELEMLRDRLADASMVIG